MNKIHANQQPSPIREGSETRGKTRRTQVSSKREISLNKDNDIVRTCRKLQENIWKRYICNIDEKGPIYVMG